MLCVVRRVIKRDIMRGLAPTVVLLPAKERARRFVLQMEIVTGILVVRRVKLAMLKVHGDSPQDTV